MLTLDSASEQLAAYPTTNGDAPVSVEEPVYVLYTSGSAGTPKGVVVRHRNLVNYAFAVAERLGVGEGERLAFATASSLSADLGNTAVFPALLTGGCLHVIPADVALDGPAVARQLERYPVDFLKITPSHFQSLLTAGDGVLPRRALVFGGEPLPPALAARVAELSRCAVFNHYGPTEATVGVLAGEVTASDVAGATGGSLPLGTPLANTEVLILDAAGQPVPEGIAGELYLGGDGVAAGYTGPVEAMAAVFLPHPFRSDESARLYRTGDRARRRSDGRFEFLGRVDRQLKIRGFRVEPGEIETRLVEQPEVTEAAVVHSPSDATGAGMSGEGRLTAYVVLSRPDAPSDDALRARLRAVLPEHMVPAAFVVLDRLPRTPGGKLDRRALPAPAVPSRVLAPPRDDIERGLLAIWSEVLGTEEIGIHDRFFEIGGHSLLATQVISRARLAFAVDLPLRSIFDAPTVAGLAEIIGLSRETPAELASVRGHG